MSSNRPAEASVESCAAWISSIGAWSEKNSERAPRAELARWMRAVTLAHPAVGRLRNDYQVWTPSIFPMTERWLSLWQQSGLELSSAMLAASASSTAIIGFVEQELVLAETTPPDDAVLSPFPNARYAFAATRDGAREFELVVRSLVDGLVASLGGGGAAPDQKGTEGAPARGGRATASARPRRAPATARSRR